MAALTDTELTEVRSHLSAACTVLDRHPDQGLAEDLIIRASIYLTLPRDSDTERCIASIIGGAPAEQIERELGKIGDRLMVADDQITGLSKKIPMAGKVRVPACLERKARAS